MAEGTNEITGLREEDEHDWLAKTSFSCIPAVLHPFFEIWSFSLNLRF